MLYLMYRITAATVRSVVTRLVRACFGILEDPDCLDALRYLATAVIANATEPRRLSQ